MRGGTSRGPVFRSDWLPEGAARDQLLLAAMGSPHPLQVDGLGGGNTLTSKVAIVSASTRPGCDIDYLFGQVSIDRALVDYRPNCGNMLSAAVPFAIEQGMVVAQDGSTQVRVYNVNTASIIDVIVQTPSGRVTYAGDARIDGVDGTAAPVLLNFEGASAESLLPTGGAMDRIDGVDVTCLVAGQTVIIMAATDLGVRGDETPAELDANRPLLARIEAIRLRAGQLMGFGDVSHSVLPKPILLSRTVDAMSVRSRYFTPHQCHQSHAATGAVAVATAFVTAGTVANRFAPALAAGQHSVGVLHPSGRIDIALACEEAGESLKVVRASLVRTARKIMTGTLYLPESIGDLK